MGTYVLHEHVFSCQLSLPPARAIGHSQEKVTSGSSQRRAPASHARRTAAPRPGQPCREAPVRDDVERAAEPGGAARRAPTGIRAHSLKSAISLPQPARVLLVADAAQARERIGGGMRLRAEPRLRDGRVVDRLPRPATQPARCLPASPRQSASRSCAFMDHRPRRLLDPVAVPARHRESRVLRAELPRRPNRMHGRRRVVGTAQRDPVVVECTLRAIGRVARRRARSHACTARKSVSW